MKYTVKDCVTGRVTFLFYRSGSLYYRCENGFIFDVPISDTGDAVFKESDKGIYFMRWIRKAIVVMENEST